MQQSRESHLSLKRILRCVRDNCFWNSILVNSMNNKIWLNILIQNGLEIKGKEKKNIVGYIFFYEFINFNLLDLCKPIVALLGWVRASKITC